MGDQTAIVKGDTRKLVSDYSGTEAAIKAYVLDIDNPSQTQLADSVIDDFGEFRSAHAVYGTARAKYLKKLPRLLELRNLFHAGDCRTVGFKLKVPIKGCYSWAEFSRTHLGMSPQGINKAIRNLMEEPKLLPAPRQSKQLLSRPRPLVDDRPATDAEMAKIPELQEIDEPDKGEPDDEPLEPARVQAKGFEAPSDDVKLAAPEYLQLIPLTLEQANDLVTTIHRHHKACTGHRFSIGVADENGILRGAAIVGRAVARNVDQDLTLEVSRLVTDGTFNVCSVLYGACARIAKEMGFLKIQTYILESEPGTSLKASGWLNEGAAGGGDWNCNVRTGRSGDQPMETKQRWARSFEPMIIKPKRETSTEL